MLVTALKTNSETIPKMDVIMERLLHEEQKLKEKGSVPVMDVDRKTLTAGRRLKRRLITCHFCCKPGHIKRECRKLAQLQAAKGAGKKAETFKQAVNSVSDDALVIGHALATTSKDIWIVDSGATCHMCNDETFFSELNNLNEPQEV